MLGADEASRLRALLDSIRAYFAGQGIVGEIRAEVVGDARMTDLHARHKDTPGTTDVLTFDLSGDPGTLDVDIVVCADEARRQATERGHGLVEELALYIVHGVLHCTGYDDREDAGEYGAAAMHRREDEILKAIGAGTVYARGNAQHAGGAP